jgi:tetratricopeptide (TPR) repeat protein
MANKYMPRLNSWRVNDAAASVSSSPTEERKQRAREWNNQGLESEDAHSKLECFEKAVQLNPQNAVFMNNKGTALTKLGLREEAISCYDQAIELDEKYKEAYFWKGQSLHEWVILKEPL